MIKSTVAGLIAFIVATASCAAASPSASAPRQAAAQVKVKAIAMLEQLNRSLNAAKYIKFKAVVAVTEDPSNPRSVEMVWGIVQAPNFMKASAVDPISNSINGSILCCNGSSYWAASDSINQYVKVNAPPEGFEPDTPSAMHFIYSVLGAGGQAALNASEQFCPADFNIADDPVAPGATRKLTYSIGSVVVNGQDCDDVKQHLSDSHGLQIIHTVISRDTHDLVRFSIDSMVGGNVRNRMQITYLTFEKGNSPMPPHDFAFVPSQKMTPYIAPASPGMDAPDFSALKPDGAPVHLSDYRGRVVVLDFWATWCGPCMVSLPGTEKLAAKYRPMHVAVIPVCTWDTKANFDTWTDAHKTWRLQWLFDPAGMDHEQSIASKLYAVSAIPTQYVIGKDGKITYVCFADTDAGGAPLDAAIEQALAAPLRNPAAAQPASAPPDKAPVTDSRTAPAAAATPAGVQAPKSDSTPSPADRTPAASPATQ